MLDRLTRPRPPDRADPTTRRAARWATAVAVPVAVLVGWLLVASATADPAPRTAAPAPSQPQETTPVQLAAPALTGQPAAACQKLVGSLPARLRDLPRRPVSAGPRQNAAYGAPPITLTCGVAAPSVAATDTVYELNGVCWLPPANQRDQAGAPGTTPEPSGGARETGWTTVGRQVPVRVVVPPGFGPASQWVNEFSAAVAAAVPATATTPSGCTG
ncbi:MAG TPA: DUF3515 family protein [Catenuloplanes sp.]|jgi:hypothetical protein